MYKYILQKCVHIINIINVHINRNCNYKQN